MNKYRVMYEIDVECDTPKEAALEAEMLMKDGYRPILRVTDEYCKCHVFDLDKEPVCPELVKDGYEGGLCPDCNGTIPDDAVYEGNCAYCSHVWNYVTPNQGE